MYDIQSGFVEQQQGASCVSRLSFYLEPHWAWGLKVRGRTSFLHVSMPPAVFTKQFQFAYFSVGGNTPLPHFRELAKWNATDTQEC